MIKKILKYLNKLDSKNDLLTSIEIWGDGSGTFNGELGKFRFKNLEQLKNIITPNKDKTFNDELKSLIEKYQTDDELHEWFTIRDSLLVQTDLIQLKITERVSGG